jgi:hypothetical protein
VLVRIGTRLLPLERISALYNDVSLRLWFGGNTILNGLKSDLLAAIAGTFFKNNPAMWDKLMKQSEQFSELMKPIIDQLQKWNEKNPHGGPVKTLNRLVF